VSLDRLRRQSRHDIRNSAQVNELLRKMNALEASQKAHASQSEIGRILRQRFARLYIILAVFTLTTGVISGYYAVLGLRSPSPIISRGTVVLGLQDASSETVSVSDFYSQPNLTYTLQFPASAIGKHWILLLFGTARMEITGAYSGSPFNSSNVQILPDAQCGRGTPCDVVSGLVEPTDTDPVSLGDFGFSATVTSTNPAIDSCRNYIDAEHPIPPAVARIEGRAPHVTTSDSPFYKRATLPSISTGGLGQDTPLNQDVDLPSELANDSSYYIPPVSGCQIADAPTDFVTIDATPSPAQLDNARGYWQVGYPTGPSIIYKSQRAELISNIAILLAGASIAFAGGLFPLWLQTRFTP